MATVSDTPWSNFSQADYTPEQWRRACLVDTGEGDQDSKERYKLPVREPDGTLNRNGVHAAAGGHGLGQVTGISDAQRRAAAKKLIAAYHDIGEDPPQSIRDMAGMSRSYNMYARSYALEGIEILSRAKGGDGRTVEAYAAVFDTPQEIRDAHGHYNEVIERTAFNRTLSANGTRKTVVLYNHGLNLDGRPDSLAQVPIGKPLEIKADGRGLLTVTRYNNSSLADSVLESIKNGDITAQSFRGPIYRSNPTRIERARPGAPLPTVRRQELGLVDYGPTPTPYYETAAIVAVRSALEIAHDIQSLADDQREELIRMLSATPDLGLSAEDSQSMHSARQRLLRLRAEAAFIGVLS